MVKVLFSFGCPRSGTTFIERCIWKLQNVVARKVSEAMTMHPYNSMLGIVDLSWLFKSEAMFIQTIRNHRDIIESFYAAKEYFPLTGIARNTDYEIVQFIIRSECSIKNQMQSDRWFSQICEIDYDRLDDDAYRREKARYITAQIETPQQNYEILLEQFRLFKVESKRKGRFYHGDLDKSFVEPEKMKWFEDKIRSILGYVRYKDGCR